MKPVFRFVASLLACLILAVVAYFAANGMINGLYAYRSPLKDTPPQPGESLKALQTPSPSRRVVFVLVDALRFDTAQNEQVMPTLAKLRAQGASAVMHSQPPSYSEAGYSTLLTGAWPYLNDGPAINLDYDQIPTWTQDNLYSAAARSGLKTAVSGYYWFEKLIPQAAVSASFYTPGEDAAADRAVVDAALPWLGDPQYALVLIHIDQVDYAGHHQGGPRGPEWNAAARRADDLLGEIVAKLDLSKDTILLVSDHGQIAPGGHGGNEPVVLTEPFVLVGAGVKPGVYGDIFMVDVAPTLAALLGTNLPASTQGQVRSEMLVLSPNVLAELPAIESQQQAGLVEHYLRAIAQGGSVQAVSNSNSKQAGAQDVYLERTVAEWQAQIQTARAERLVRERLGNSLVMIVLLFALGGLVYYFRIRPGGWQWLAALVYVLVFNGIYLGISQNTYSFSSLAGAVALIVYCCIVVGIAFGAGWLLFAWRTRLFRCRPMQAAQKTLHLALLLAGLLLLPVLFNLAINGFVTTWTLPEPLSFYTAFLSWAQILVIGLEGALFSGLAAIISRVLNGKTPSLPIIP